MAKIARYGGNLRAFAADALGTERTVFGDVIQSDTLDANITADWFRGWGIVGVNEAPTKQDFNAVGFTMGRVLAYLHQQGVAEWHVAQEYNSGAITSVAGGYYLSQADGNIGFDPATDGGAKWRPLITNTIRASATITPATDADVTLTYTQYSKQYLPLATGAWTTAHDVIVPAEPRWYLVYNGSSYTATVKVSGGPGVTVEAGKSQLLICNGTAVVDPLAALDAPVVLAPVATTSGTSIPLASDIPSWANEININFDQLSTNGIDHILLRVGGAVVDTTNYLGAASYIGATVSSSNAIDGIALTSTPDSTAGAIRSGAVTLRRLSGNAWAWSGALARSDGNATSTTAGRVAMAEALTRLVLTTRAGADAFDLGSVGVTYRL